MGNVGKLKPLELIELALGIVLPAVYQKSVGQQQFVTIGGHTILGYSLTHSMHFTTFMDNDAAVRGLSPARHFLFLPRMPPADVPLLLSLDTIQYDFSAFCAEHGGANDVPNMQILYA